MHFFIVTFSSDRPTDRPTTRRDSATARRRDAREGTRERARGNEGTRATRRDARGRRARHRHVAAGDARASATAVVGGVVGDRGRRRGRGESARGRARGVVGVRALRPNAEWPPEDVWEDFVAAHAGEYAGAAATFDGKTGRAMPLPERYVPDAFKEYGVDVMEWQIVTRGAMTNDGDGLRLETSRLYPEAGCEYGKSDVAMTESLDVCAGGQMGKMFIVQGCYADGPKILPECVEGAEAKFTFAFAEEDAPGERRRVEITVKAAPGEKRDWRMSKVDVTHETSSESGLKAKSPAEGDILAEDAVSLGEWRAVNGVTFIAIEALEDVPEDRNAESASGSSAAAGAAQKLAREKPDDRALVAAAAAEKEAEEKRAKEEREAAAREPEGMIVVPWWAVKSPSSWSMGGEYVVGGNSPLVFLPNNIWVLIESVDDQLVVECGRYDQGAPGRDFDETERRVIARRYRKGRFASTFFVRECRLDPEEREDEKEEFDIFDDLDGLDDR